MNAHLKGRSDKWIRETAQTALDFDEVMSDDHGSIKIGAAVFASLVHEFRRLERARDVKTGENEGLRSALANHRDSLDPPDGVSCAQHVLDCRANPLSLTPSAKLLLARIAEFEEIEAGNEYLSNEQLVDRCNQLADKFYRSRGYNASDGFKFYDSTHPEELGLWNQAVIAWEHIEGVEVDEALEEVLKDAEAG